MAKEKLEIYMNYPPGTKVDVWNFGHEKGWKEAIVVERTTGLTLSGTARHKWRLKLKGEGKYLMEKEVHDPTEMRLRMEGQDGRANRELIERFKQGLRADILLYQELVGLSMPDFYPEARTSLY